MGSHIKNIHTRYYNFFRKAQIDKKKMGKEDSCIQQNVIWHANKPIVLNYIKHKWSSLVTLDSPSV